MTPLKQLLAWLWKAVAGVLRESLLLSAVAGIALGVYFARDHLIAFWERVS